MKNKQEKIENNDSLIVEKAISIDAGAYKGVINKIEKVTITSEKDNKEYTYLDIYFKISDDLPEIKTGYNWKLSELTHLGKFLIKSGFELIEGKNVTLTDIKKHLLFKKCSFVVYNDGNFAKITDETIKFL